MKKLLLVFLTLCLTLCACIPKALPEQGSSESSSSSSESESSSSSESESSSSSSGFLDEQPDNAYLDIERFKPNSFKERHFAIRDSKYVLTFSAPREWSFAKNGNDKYKIYRSGTEIGTASRGSVDSADEWSIIAEKKKDKKTMLASEYVEKKGSGESAEYRYRWCYSYTENNVDEQINIIVTCSEAPELSTYYMLTLASLKEAQTKTAFGEIGELDSPKILVVGNSFVGTSEIGDCLKEMLIANGKGGDVYSISIGMGNIGKYADNDTVMLEIQQGEYDLVLMSGFYGSDDSASLGIIKDACDSASSILVTLPAHNENITSARSSSRKCEVLCLEWLTEIDNFIKGGVDKWALCYNDSYYHSTPLAGYIGAHMIYRAIYSECPSAPVEFPMFQGEIDAVLGDYSSTGSVNVVNPTLIKYFG